MYSQKNICIPAYIDQLALFVEVESLDVLGKRTFLLYLLYQLYNIHLEPSQPNSEKPLQAENTQMLVTKLLIIRLVLSTYLISVHVDKWKSLQCFHLPLNISFVYGSRGFCICTQFLWVEYIQHILEILHTLAICAQSVHKLFKNDTGFITAINSWFLLSILFVCLLPYCCYCTCCYCFCSCFSCFSFGCCLEKNCQFITVKSVQQTGGGHTSFKQEDILSTSIHMFRSCSTCLPYICLRNKWTIVIRLQQPV